MLSQRAPAWGAELDVPYASADASNLNAEVLRLFEEHGPALYRFCRSVLSGSGEDAEDIVQDAFLKLLRHVQDGGDRSNLKSWLFTVAANACRTRLRWRIRWQPWNTDRDERAAAPAEPDVDRRRASAAFRTLPARDRLLLALRAQGFSYRDIAAAAGLREASVGRLLARAVQRWKRAAGRIET